MLFSFKLFHVKCVEIFSESLLFLKKLYLPDKDKITFKIVVLKKYRSYPSFVMHTMHRLKKC